MYGVVRYIRSKRNRCSLIDEDGVERTFSRSDVVVADELTVEQSVSVHDVVTFTTWGADRAVQVQRHARHTAGIVYSF